MRRPSVFSSRWGVLVAAAIVTTSCADVQPRPAAPASAAVAEVSIPNTRRVDFISKVNGHRYSIDVALPFKPAPPRGYPVLYVLDGYAYFASATEAARTQRHLPGGIVVVGIGYPDDPAYQQEVMAKRGPGSRVWDGLPTSHVAPFRERMYDLSLPTSEEYLVGMSRQGYPQWDRENYGGLDDFLETIEREVKPRVASLASIDSSNQALFGHSMAGYAALHALFVQPGAFRSYIIASPSIFWDNKAVLRDREKLAAAVRAGRASPRVLVTVGSDEDTSWGYPSETATVANGRALVAWLKTLRGDAGYVIEDYAVFEKSGHSLAAWPALARGIDFAFHD